MCELARICMSLLDVNAVAQRLLGNPLYTEFCLDATVHVTWALRHSKVMS